MIHKIYTLFLVYALVLPAFLFCDNAYEVHFRGITDPIILEQLNNSSQMRNLQNNPPATHAGLKRRAEADTPNLIQALHSSAHYNAKIHLSIDYQTQPIDVVFDIEQDVVYPFIEFEIIPVEDSDASSLMDITPAGLGIRLGEPALPKSILVAEDTLLKILAQRGYPLAKIQKREVLADQERKGVIVRFFIATGSRCVFGDVHIRGHERVSEDFILKKIGWQRGEVFDPTHIEQTQNALEATGLFSSISIERDEVRQFGNVPIVIDLVESKHRSIGVGVSYATQRGPGVSAEWENRNIRGMGEKLSLKGNIWAELQDATFLYLIPDFLRPRQDLIWLLEYEHERTRGYSQMFYSVSGIVERQLDKNLRVSFGGTVKKLHDTRSDNDRDFGLLKSPFQLRWNNTNDILDPTTGMSVNLKIVPTVQVIKPQFMYSINTLIATSYLPLNPQKTFVLANKLTFGTIVGATHHAIPPSERFYAGSENALRGYHYLTVSPLNHHHRPVGGRSMLIYAIETRFRFNETFGWIFFYEVGNVYEDFFPHLDKKVLQSAGVGLRYYTPLGPLRLDIGVPLNRRRHVDGPAQIYASIGQAF